MTDNERTIARAAYRLGLLDALLHPDMIDRADESHVVSPPAIVVASLTGERQHRLDELRVAGVDNVDDVLDGMRIG